MKAVFLLFFCFGVLPVFSATHSVSALITSAAGNEDEAYTKKEVEKYYKNGNLKRRQTVFYNPDGSQYQTIYETYRRNGVKRDCRVMNMYDDIIQHTAYNQQGRMRFERNYYYKGIGRIASIETRRANGETQVWEQPPPESGTLYVRLY